MNKQIDTNALVPAVHLNGDSRQRLLDMWAEFAHALRLIKIPETHGRNYYVKHDDNAENRAMEEREKIQGMIRQLLTVAEEVAVAILEQ
jgi:hypothetical protein